MYTYIYAISSMKLAVLCNDPNVYCVGTVYTTAIHEFNIYYQIKMVKENVLRTENFKIVFCFIF